MKRSWATRQLPKTWPLHQSSQCLNRRCFSSPQRIWDIQETQVYEWKRKENEAVNLSFSFRTPSIDSQTSLLPLGFSLHALSAEQPAMKENYKITNKRPVVRCVSYPRSALRTTSLLHLRKSYSQWLSYWPAVNKRFLPARNSIISCSTVRIPFPTANKRLHFLYWRWG